MNGICSFIIHIHTDTKNSTTTTKTTNIRYERIIRYFVLFKHIHKQPPKYYVHIFNKTNYLRKHPSKHVFLFLEMDWTIMQIIARERKREKARNPIKSNTQPKTKPQTISPPPPQISFFFHVRIQMTLWLQ